MKIHKRLVCSILKRKNYKKISLEENMLQMIVLYDSRIVHNDCKWVIKDSHLRHVFLLMLHSCI